MWGEITVAIYGLETEIEEAQEARETFRLANDQTMNEWLFDKKMSEWDDKISTLEAYLEGLYDERHEMIEEELEELEACLPPDPDPFEAVFNELCEIPGVATPCQPWN